MTGPGRVHVHVRMLRVVGGSTIEARRVAEALPAALERVLATWPESAPRDVTSTGRPAVRWADEVAVEVAARVVRDVGTSPPEVVR